MSFLGTIHTSLQTSLPNFHWKSWRSPVDMLTMELTFWDFVIVLSFVFILLYIYGTKNFGHFKKFNIKHHKPHPFIGNMAQTMFARDHMLKALDRFYKKFPAERYIGYYEFSNPGIWLRDPEIIKQIMVKDFEHFVDHRNNFSENIDPLYANNLFSLAGQKWKEMRSTLSPAFTGSKMKLMFPLILDCSKQLSNYIEEQLKINSEDMIEVEAKDLFTRYANDVIATCAFGISVDSLKSKCNEFYLMGKKITDYNMWFFIKFVAISCFPRLMKKLGLSIMKKEEANFFRNIVKQTISFREEKGIIRQDMIQLLMEAQKGNLKHEMTDNHDSESSSLIYAPKKRVWTDDELASQAFVFFLAGFDTSSTFLSYITYEIATRPNVQNKVREEIDNLLSKNETITYEMLTKMTYLDMVISECLRFWPPVLGVDRVCVKPYTLPPPNESVNNGYELKVGDFLFIPIRSLHKDPKYFPNPEEFIPERFSNENKSSIIPFTYLPFGAGPRACIGSRFALMEIKSVLTHILTKYELVKCSKTEDPAVAKMGATTILPINGIWVGLKLRQD